MVTLIFTKALRSLTERLTFGTIARCILVTAAALALWVAGASSALYYTTVFTTGWLESILDWLLGSFSVITAWFLFPLLVPAIATLFIDRFLIRIAQEEYQRELRSVPIKEELPKTLSFLALALFLNLFLYPFYLFPPIGQILYYIVNGYLLAREFWEMICDRMMLDQSSLRKRRSTLVMLGAALVGCANVPLLNLFTPLLAGAVMLHLGMYALANQSVKEWRHA